MAGKDEAARKLPEVPMWELRSYSGWFGYPTVWINGANGSEEELSVTADVIAPDLRTLPESLSALHSHKTA